MHKRKCLNLENNHALPDIESSDRDYLLMCRIVSDRQSKHKYLCSDDNLRKRHRIEETLLKRGWQKINIGEEVFNEIHGHFAIAYWRQTSKDEIEVSIAHRGTCLDQAGNLFADWQLLFQEFPLILQESVYPYLRKLFGVYNLYPMVQVTIEGKLVTKEVSKIIHTGFSLGGAIAATCACLTTHHRVYAVTFDAPGINYTVEDFAATRIVNYLCPENLVNTTNRHIGKLRKLHLEEQQMEKKYTTAAAKISQLLTFPSDDDLSYFSKQSHLQKQICNLQYHNLDVILGSNDNQLFYDDIEGWENPIIGRIEAICIKDAIKEVGFVIVTELFEMARKSIFTQNSK